MQGTGILVHGPSSDLVISDNPIQARENGILMIGGQNMTITSNHLCGGTTRILLQSTSAVQVRRNFIIAESQGVPLEQQAWNNEVQRNSILCVYLAGIVLTRDVTNNRVLANRVLCALGTPCHTVSADEVTFENNKIAGDRP
jgi:hypothetical protein